jgi:hypothetical protein
VAFVVLRSGFLAAALLCMPIQSLAADGQSTCIFECTETGSGTDEIAAQALQLVIGQYGNSQYGDKCLNADCPANNSDAPERVTVASAAPARRLSSPIREFCGWAMVLLGLGIIGFATFRRKVSPVFTAGA